MLTLTLTITLSLKMTLTEMLISAMLISPCAALNPVVDMQTKGDENNNKEQSYQIYSTCICALLAVTILKTLSTAQRTTFKHARKPR